MKTWFFPTVLIALDCAASFVYAWKGDWCSSGYWFCAGSISFFALMKSMGY